MHLIIIFKFYNGIKIKYFENNSIFIFIECNLITEVTPFQLEFHQLFCITHVFILIILQTPMPFYADPNRFTTPVWQADPSQGMQLFFTAR